MQRALRYQDRFCGALDKSLSGKGFSKADGARIRSILDQNAYRGPPIVYPDEEIYIRNREIPQPLFSVFVKRNRSADAVTILTSNPREDAAGSGLPQSKQYVKCIFSEKSHPGASPELVADSISDFLSALSCLKRSFRMQVHFHARNMLNENKLAHDDGWSTMSAIIRRGLLHHVDFLCYTPHNAMEFDNQRIAGEILSEFGIVFPPACEITMPLMKNHPNGPHHVVIAGTAEAAEELDLAILRLKSPGIAMPSYYLGATLDEMYNLIQPLRSAGKVIMGPAHPVNHSEKTLPVNGIGLFSAVQLGLLSLAAAKDLCMMNDFIECWNDSIYGGEMSFRSDALENEMRRLYAVHGQSLGLPPDIRFSANLCNLLLAAEAGRLHGLGQSYGSDNHTEAPLDRGYLVGGDPFSRGWTTITIPEDLKPKVRSISSEDLVRWLSQKKAKMGAVLFTEIRQNDNTLQLVQSRTERPAALDRIVGAMSRKQYSRYVHDLVADLFGFLGHGEFDALGNMAK